MSLPAGTEESDLRWFLRRVFRHTPTKHSKHTDAVPCGCAIARKQDAFICSCGAAYTSEAFSFPLWRCYDCGTAWWTSEAALMQKRANAR